MRMNRNGRPSSTSRHLAGHDPAGSPVIGARRLDRVLAVVPGRSVGQQALAVLERGIVLAIRERTAVIDAGGPSRRPRPGARPATRSAGRCRDRRRRTGSARPWAAQRWTRVSGTLRRRGRRGYPATRDRQRSGPRPGRWPRGSRAGSSPAIEGSCAPAYAAGPSGTRCGQTVISSRCSPHTTRSRSLISPTVA